MSLGRLCPSQGAIGLRSNRPRVILPKVMWPENSYVAQNIFSSHPKCWFLSPAWNVIMFNNIQTSLPHIHRARFISSKIKDDMYYIYLACFISSRFKERDVLPLPDLQGSSNGGAKKEDIQIYETRVQALLPIFPPPPHTPGNPRRACLWRLKERDILHTLYF